MSKFFLVEFRYKRQRRWHPWMRTDGKAAAMESARYLLKSYDAVPASASRAVCIDTDAGTVTVCWEGKR